MAINVAINGFGRMGRLTLRNVFDDPEIKVVAINSRGTASFYAHLLKYDSSYGKWDKSVEAVNSHGLVVDSQPIKFFQELDPSLLPWKDLGVDVVIESTGVFRDRENSQQHITAGARRVVITAPADGEDITLVPGVNLDSFKPAEHQIISSASCTSNCLAPIIKTLLDSSIEIKHGFMTTIHAYTNDQHLVDAPHKKEDFRRARAATESIIPTDTGAAKTIGRLIPEMDGKLNGIAMRVPVVLPSVITLALEVSNATTAEEINGILKQSTQGKMKGIMDYSNEPLVSVDYKKNPYAAIIDGLSTKVVDNTLVNIVAWYDNEWGYINQLTRVIKHVGVN